MSSIKSLLRSPRLLIVLCPFLLLAPVWLFGKALYWGTPSTQFVPWWWQAWLTLRSGDLPLWNPMVGMGAPLLANYQSALLYPPTWLYLLMAAFGGLPLMAWWQAISVALHLVWAGWGMAALVRKLGKSDVAQTVAGLAFSLSGYLVARAHFLSINATVSWLPWVLFAAYNLAREPRRVRTWLWLSLALAMQWLAGHAQIVWYTLLLAIAWTAFWTWKADRWKGVLRSTIGFGAAAGLALALSAAQWLPTAEYLVTSQRATLLDYATVATYSLWPWRLLGLIAPNFFGNPTWGNFWGYGNFWEDAIYIGLLPFLFAVISIVGARRIKEKSLVWFLAGTALVSIALALGENTPLFEWLFRYVPSFDMFQAPTRFTIWLVFALSLLAGIALDAWRAPKGKALYWSRLSVAGAVAVIVVATLGIVLRSSLPIPETFAWSFLIVGILSLIIAIANLKVPGLRAPKTAWSWLIVSLVAIDLLVAGWGLNPGTNLTLYRETATEVHSTRTYIPLEDEYAIKYETVFRFDTFFSTGPLAIRANGLPNITILDGQPSANNFDPLVPARYAAWITALDTSLQQGLSEMLELASIDTLAHFSEVEGLTFESVLAKPRIRWASCATFVPEQSEALRALSEVDTDVVVIEAEGIDPTCSESQASIELIREQASTLTLIVEAGGPGWLVVADTWYPGWGATVDGKETILYKANGLFRAVYLDAGVHRVEMRYQAKSFAIGLTITLLSLPTFALFWKRSGRPSK